VWGASHPYFGRHNEVLALLIARHTGEVVRMTGDGFFATFADPGDAIDCAVTIQGSLEENRRSTDSHPRSASVST
jgi:class 3 adenylate cyclase